MVHQLCVYVVVIPLHWYMSMGGRDGSVVGGWKRRGAGCGEGRIKAGKGSSSGCCGTIDILYPYPASIYLPTSIWT